MKPFSISLRLGIWYAGLSVLGFALFGIAMWFVLTSSMLAWKDRTLQMRATRVQAALATMSRRDDAAMIKRLNEVVGLLPEGELIRVARNDGQPLFPRDVASHTSRLPLSSCPIPSLRDVFVGREKYRQMCMPALYAGDTVYVVAPSPLLEDRILLRNFTYGLLRTIPFILLLSGVGGYVLSRRALRPVDLLIAEAKTITPDNLTRRLTVSAADDQLRRLAMEWNGLLSRIHSAMSQVAQFTADASHELRTPVAYIRATAEYSLGLPSLDDETREGLCAIVDEARLMSDLLENLLTLARLDMTPGSLRSETADVGSVIAEVAEYFRPAVNQKEQALTVMPTDAVRASVCMSALHLRRILTVILDNAVKYTPVRGRITVACNMHETVDVVVADSGIGIAAEHLGRIFDRFYRVDQSRTDVTEGVGLGLSIAKLIAELYGARIDVVSSVGQGTTVTMRLPPSCP